MTLNPRYSITATCLDELFALNRSKWKNKDSPQNANSKLRETLPRQRCGLSQAHNKVVECMLATMSVHRKDIDQNSSGTKFSRTARSGSIHGDLSPGLEILPDDYLRETIAANYDAYTDGDVHGTNNLSQFGKTKAPCY